MADSFQKHASRRYQHDSRTEWATRFGKAHYTSVKTDINIPEPVNGYPPIQREPNDSSNYDPRTWPRTMHSLSQKWKKGLVNEIFMLTSRDDFLGLCYLERPIPSQKYEHMKAHDYLVTQVERRAWEKYGGPNGLAYAKAVRDERKNAIARANGGREQASIAVPPSVQSVVPSQTVYAVPARHPMSITPSAPTAASTATNQPPVPRTPTRPTQHRLRATAPTSLSDEESENDYETVMHTPSNPNRASGGTSGLTPSVSRVFVGEEGRKTLREEMRMGSPSPMGSPESDNEEDPSNANRTESKNLSRTSSHPPDKLKRAVRIKAEEDEYANIPTLPRRIVLAMASDSDEDFIKPTRPTLRRSESVSPTKRRKSALVTKEEPPEPVIKVENTDNTSRTESKIASRTHSPSKRSRSVRAKEEDNYTGTVTLPRRIRRAITSDSDEGLIEPPRPTHKRSDNTSPTKRRKVISVKKEESPEPDIKMEDSFLNTSRMNRRLPHQHNRPTN